MVTDGTSDAEGHNANESQEPYEVPCNKQSMPSSYCVVADEQKQ